ncbi:MAG: hypothetical protein ACFCAD_10805 [Pleurocapsa sp.]
MIPDLLFEQYEEEDLIDQFSEYTALDLQSNLLKLIQTNIIYSYCESLIIEDVDCTEEKIAEILNYSKERNQTLLNSSFPFHILHQLKQAKDEVKQSSWDKHQTINIILNLIVENTLLHSSLAKFAYN